MAGVQPTKFINYISQFKKLLVTRNNGIIQQKFKIDSATDDNYYFSIVNSNNRLIDLTGRSFKIYGSIFDSKDQMHILFYSDKCTIEQNGQQMHFKIDTYTSQYMNIVKTNKIIDLTIVQVPSDSQNEQQEQPEIDDITQVILRDTAIAYKRPYIENQTPTEILQKVILTTNVPLTGVFGSGQDINLTIGSNGAAFGTGLTQTGNNQLVIGQYNEVDNTKVFVIGNGENDTARSNLFTIDYEGNIQTPGAISANAIVVDGQDVGNKVNQLENDIEAVSAAIPSVEGFATEQWVQDQGYLTAHQSLDGYATEQWVLNKGYITGVNLDPYATKDQLTAYATKSDLTVSASILTNQISQLALNIPTKVSDLTNDAGYITGYNAGTGISISNGTISLTGEVGKTYYADGTTLQLNEANNTFSVKSIRTKLNNGPGISLTEDGNGVVTITNTGGGGSGGYVYTAGTGLGLSTVTEGAEYQFYVDEAWFDQHIDAYTSGLQNYTAGTGIAISNENVISVTGMVTEAEIADYATKDYVDSSVSGKANINDVYTKEEVYTYLETDAKINEATSGKADLSTVQAVDDKFANYYTSAQVDDAISTAIDEIDIPSTVYTGEDGIKVENGVISLTATLSSITNDAGFITSADIPTSYVQQSELESVSGQLTNAIGAKANTTDVEAEFTATSAWANETFLTEHQSLSSYYTKSEADSAIGTATNDMATQTWVEEQGYLTAHQSLDDYYNKTQVDTALALKADSADVYTKTEVNNISTNIVNQIPTDVATSAYVQAASGNAVSVATGWVQDKNYLSSINVIQQDTEFDENTSKLFFNEGFTLTQTEDMVRIDVDTNSIATQEYVTDQVSGKADQSTVESLSTALSTAIDTKANSTDVYTKSEVYTKGETDTAINTATSGKVNKSDFDTVTGALSTAIDGKTTSGEVKTQIEAYGYQNATDVANAISGKADKSELQSVSGTLNTAIGGVSDRVGAIEADYTTSAQVSNIVTGYDYISAITVVNEYQQFEENTKKLTFDIGFGLTQTEDTVRIELDPNYIATVDALSSVSGTLTGQISAVDTKATNNTNSINDLTGRVKAIEDDYTTSAYVTGQVNNLATGAVATNTANIGQLSTDLGTVSGKANTNETNIGLVSSDLGTLSGELNTTSTFISGKVSALSGQLNTASTTLLNKFANYYDKDAVDGKFEATSTYIGTVSANIEGDITSAYNDLTGKINTASSTLTSQTNYISGQVDANNNSLTSRVKAIEDDYTTSAYVTGQVNDVVTGKINPLTARVKNIEDTYYTQTQIDNKFTATSTYIGTVSADLTGRINTASTTLTSQTSYLSGQIDDTNTLIATTSGNLTGLLSSTSATLTTSIKAVDDKFANYYNKTDVDSKFTATSTYINTTSTTLNNNLTGKINTASTTLTSQTNYLSGQIDTTNEKVGTVSGNLNTVSGNLNTVSGKVDVINADYVTSGVLTAYVNNQYVAVSQLANDVGYITAGDLPAGTVYLAGTGLNLSNATFSVDESWLTGKIAEQGGSSYSAGTGIDITNNVISISASWLTAQIAAQIPTYTAGVGLVKNGTQFSLSAAGAGENKVLSSHNGVISWETNVAGGGGGGTTYTEGAGIDISDQDVISIDQDWLNNHFSPTITNKKNIIVDNEVKDSNFQLVYNANKDIFVNTIESVDGVITINQVSGFVGDNGQVACFEHWIKADGTLTGFVGDGVELVNVPATGLDATKTQVFTRRIVKVNDVVSQYAVWEYQFSNTAIPTTEKIIAVTPQDFTFNLSSDTTASISYEFTGENQQSVGFTYSGSLPDGISFSNGTFSNTGSQMVGNSTATIPVTISALNAQNETLERIVYCNLTLTGFELVEVPNQELEFAYNTNATSGIQYTYHGNQSNTVEVQLTGSYSLPAGVSFNNGTFTCVGANLTGNTTRTLTAYISGADVEPITTEFDLTIADVPIVANNQTFNFDFREQDQTSALAYTHLGSATVNVSNANLPNGISYANGYFTATSGAGVANGTTAATTTISADDADSAIITTTFNLIGVVDATFTGNSETVNMNFGNASSYTSAITYTYNGAYSNSIQVSYENLPSGVTATSSYNNGTLTITFTGTNETVKSNGEFNTIVKLIANDTVETTFTVTFNISGIIEYDYLRFTAKNGPAKVALVRSTGSLNPPLSTSVDGGVTWTSYAVNDVISLAENETVMFSGTSTDMFNRDNYASNKFSITGLAQCHGDLASVINFASSYSSNYAYWRYLFQNCSGLLTAPKIAPNILNMPSACCSNMFLNCTSLTAAPELPATGLATSCYETMFKGCTSLVTLPSVLPATTLATKCYYQMFSGCTALTNIPKNLIRATTYANNCCQDMFNGCTSLTGIDYVRINTSSLPDTACRSMFSRLPNISGGYVKIDATNLANYSIRDIIYASGNSRNRAIIDYFEVSFTNWDGNRQNINGYWFGDSGYPKYFIKPQALPIKEDNPFYYIPTASIILNRKSDGKLYYAEAAEGHAVDDPFTGEDPLQANQ